MNFNKQNLLRVIVFCLTLSIIGSCSQKEDHFTGGDVKTWLLLDSSNNRYDHVKNGFVVMQNGFGIFITSRTGQEQVRQPELHDAHPMRLVHCMFKWEIKNKTLTFDYHGRTKQNILLLNNDTLKLESNNEVLTYVRE